MNFEQYLFLKLLGRIKREVFLYSAVEMASMIEINRSVLRRFILLVPGRPKLPADCEYFFCHKKAKGYEKTWFTVITADDSTDLLLRALVTGVENAVFLDIADCRQGGEKVA